MVSEDVHVFLDICRAFDVANPSTFSVHPARHNRDGNEEPSPSHDAVPVSQIIIHSGYNITNSLNHDVALVKLDTALIYSKKVLPVCVPGQGDYGDHSEPWSFCTLVGWGLTRQSKLTQIKAYM